LNQIEYHVASGLFQNPQDALVICEKLCDLTWHMQRMAEHGRMVNLRIPMVPNLNCFEER
jgi:hypothetical protein